MDNITWWISWFFKYKVPWTFWWALWKIAECGQRVTSFGVKSARYEDWEVVMIRFTEDGIFADAEGEKQAFYDRTAAGDSIIIAHLALYKKELASQIKCQTSTLRRVSDG